MPSQPHPGFPLSDAAVIATFYLASNQPIQNGKEAIVQHLIHALGLTSYKRDGWTEKQNETILRCYGMDRPHTDIRVVQLVLNRRGEMGLDGRPWLQMRELLEQCLEPALLAGVRGYTLVYQAELATDATVDSIWAKIPPAIQRLHIPDSSPPPLPVLAKTRMPGGHIGLLHIPLGNDGSEAAMVYLALSQDDPDHRLVKRTLLGTHALLFLPDLIAHKGYHQIRQYRYGDITERYSHNVEVMRETTGTLLNINIDTDTAGMGKVLTAMLPQYDKLVEVVLQLQGLQISLDQQISNYRLDLDRIEGKEDNAVLQFHHRQLVISKHDLDLLVTKGKDVLDVAGATLNVRRAKLEEISDRRQKEEQRVREERQRQDRAQNEARQQHLQMVIGMVGIGLALSQIIDKAVVAGLLGLVWQPVPAEGYNVLTVFIIQAVIIFLLVVVVWVVWVAITKWLGKMKRQP